MLDNPKKLLEFITKLMDRAEAEQDLSLAHAAGGLMKLAWKGLLDEGSAETRDRFHTVKS